MGRVRRRVTGVALVAVCVLVGCIRANTIECGDLSCPETLQCVADRCVTDEQVESCRTMTEGSECNADGVINGHCIAGACVDSICGNGIEELGEACDDGNVIGEDGCSARCDSNELCGNATVDLFREQCDEGIAALSGDGCSSQCTVEYPTWLREIPRELSARFDHAMVSIDRPNPTASSILLFGGSTVTATVTNETWSWQGNQWQQLRPRTNPPAIKTPVMAYDKRRNRVVLMIGADSTFGVWEWDGVDWSQRMQNGPGPKTVIAAAYHEAAEKVIAWDGSASFQWDGTSWLKLQVGPPARGATVLAYFKRSDGSGGDVVMFGGRGLTMMLDDTWLFDGTNWREVVFGTKPTPRQFAMMTWDPFRNRIVLFGGTALSTTFDDTWIYDGMWLATADLSARRRSGAMAFDPVNDRVMVHGGQNEQGPATMTLGDQQAYGSGWAPIANPVKPSALCHGTLAYLPAEGETVFSAVDKSWRWDGIQWNLLPAGPAQRCNAAAASGPTGSDLVVFGGNVGATYWRDTWAWNGKAWTGSPNASPVERKSHAMALDERSGRTVLFGGLGKPMGVEATTDVYADTWEWDGSTWTLRATVDAPARHGHALAFDRTTQTLVMFGGQDKDGLLATTFELDGMTWRSHVTAHAPLATAPVVMATGSRGRPVLLDAARQTWELQRENNVVDWIRLPTIGTPPVLASSTLAYDAVRDQLLLVGVGSGEVQVWSLTFVSPLPRESCIPTEDLDGDEAMGCADPDCWATCDPQCPPVAVTTCDPLRARCGDGTCSALEDYQVCPSECLPP